MGIQTAQDKRQSHLHPRLMAHLAHTSEIVQWCCMLPKLHERYSCIQVHHSVYDQAFPGSSSGDRLVLRLLCAIGRD